MSSVCVYLPRRVLLIPASQNAFELWLLLVCFHVWIALAPGEGAPQRTDSTQELFCPSTSWIPGIEFRAAGGKGLFPLSRLPSPCSPVLWLYSLKHKTKNKQTKPTSLGIMSITVLLSEITEYQPWRDYFCMLKTAPVAFTGGYTDRRRVHGSCFCVWYGSISSDCRHDITAGFNGYE